MADIEQDHIFTAQYFLDLDLEFTPEQAEEFARRWNMTGTQSMEDVRRGRREEEDCRYTSATAEGGWAEKLDTK